MLSAFRSTARSNSDTLRRSKWTDGRPVPRKARPRRPASAAGSLPAWRIGRPKRARKAASNSFAEPPGLTADTPWALYATKTGPIGVSSLP